MKEDEAKLFAQAMLGLLLPIAEKAVERGLTEKEVAALFPRAVTLVHG